ncbi:RHS repeat domain-containing protein [Streptomyces sp. MspMP-M5]|uniref:RHS repeat domain-containing protein n=1 Tax=Streptomyces sp. SID8354 TaxID=2690339 RepID=UPI001F31CDF8|nr:RHS repeat domain-containing protein [Streptomyces sp. MspMP-M5]
MWRQECDSRGNRTAVVDPTGATTRYTYDSRGHLTSVTDALGHVTHLSSDEAGRVLSTVGPASARTSCQRDSFGRVIALTDPLGATTRLAWTADCRLTARIHSTRTRPGRTGRMTARATARATRIRPGTPLTTSPSASGLFANRSSATR